MVGKLKQLQDMTQAMFVNLLPHFGTLAPVTLGN
jgi:hypothetical protein